RELPSLPGSDQGEERHPEVGLQASALRTGGRGFWLGCRGGPTQGSEEAARGGPGGLGVASWSGWGCDIDGGNAPALCWAAGLLSRGKHCPFLAATPPRLPENAAAPQGPAPCSTASAQVARTRVHTSCSPWEPRRAWCPHTAGTGRAVYPGLHK
ncbi:hypothetical protein H1C71_011669, partial [Ictidomys tridecemlineatus]